MTKQTQTRICLIMFLLGCVVWYYAAIGIACKINHSPPPKVATSASPAGVGSLLSIKDVQLIIGAEPDGKLGPETQEKWDDYICDHHATESFKVASVLEVD